MTLMLPAKDWPYTNDKITYVIGHPYTLKLLDKPRKRKIFRKNLIALKRFTIRKQIRFVRDPYSPEEFLYVCDLHGLQLIIEVDWAKSKKPPVDISKYDA